MKMKRAAKKSFGTSAMEKYFPAFKKDFDEYVKSHPHWRLEVLASFLRMGIRSLQRYVENPRQKQITWEDPFVGLHYQVGWNWKVRRMTDLAPCGHIFGHVTRKNTATPEKAKETLAKIMTNWFNHTALADFTNWAWYEKWGDHYTPVLPMETALALNDITDERARRELFDELVRPFSIGAVSLDWDVSKVKNFSRVPKRVRTELARKCKSLDIQQIAFNGEINGRQIDLVLAAQIHPLIADYDKKKAWHPITVGLVFQPKFVNGEVVTVTPAEWPKKDRMQLWSELAGLIGPAFEKLIPKKEQEKSIILSVNSKIKIPAALWRPENKVDTIKYLADLQSQAGDLQGIHVDEGDVGLEFDPAHRCPVCGWSHDPGFRQIIIGPGEVVSLAGCLPEIVRLVHCSHEKGFAALSSKDDALGKACGGYHNPCKAFDDLNRRAEYKKLFDTRRRGFIALRGFPGISRNKSEQTLTDLPPSPA